MSTHLAIAFLVDFDGTLVDSEPAEFRAMEPLIERHRGRALTKTEWESWLGRSTLDLLRELLPEVDLEEAADEFHQAHLSALLEINPLPGVAAFLQLATSIAPCVIVSGSSASMIEPWLRRYALDRFVHAVIGCESYRRGKPDAEPFLVGASHIGVLPERCLAVEDSTNGIQSAISAGVPVLAIEAGNPVGRHDLSEADLVLPSLEDASIGAIRRVMSTSCQRSSA